ncbi:queuosine precursor transporter [Zoogloea sp.]|uniref:queuosine precursor transporter n=1 Tax=Zoogloea sp. TaxID=49181 RepID=UPI001AC82E49|nr:queuosine precursor transporter [Zoogloea sp.]MBN8283081.1 queuosine precursor transporter [Zoogloea sp.]
MKKEYRYLTFVTGIFVATLLISNTLDTKIFAFGSLALPAGIILFPLAYLFGDILTEVYGYATSRKVIWSGFFSLLLMVLTYEIARQLPPASFWTDQQAYDHILGKVPRIVLASIVAYFLGEFCNSYVLAKIKVRMQGRIMPLRFVLSTVVGQAIDTSVFVLIAFAGIFPTAELVSLTLSGWAFKVGWEVLALPFTMVVVRFLKKAEGEDYYDTDTDFNPFHVLRNNIGDEPVKGGGVKSS